MKFDYLQLKYLIKSKGYTQENLANELNISSTSLNNKLNNRVEFRFEEIYKLIDLLDIDDKEVKSVFFKPSC